MNTIRISAVAIATAIVLFFASNVQAVGNDFFNGTLRYDLPEVANATGYQLTLVQAENPNITFLSPKDFVTAWLGIYLDHQPGLYGLKFAQVGLMRRSNGLQWFVYAESGFNYLSPIVSNVAGKSQAGCYEPKSLMVSATIYFGFTANSIRPVTLALDRHAFP